jgi:hypothetical protein
MKSPAAIAALWVSAIALGGCGVQQVMLDTENDYLLLAMDSLAAPGREIVLQAQVRGGDFLRGQCGLAVRFFRDGVLFKVAETGDDGIAAVTFTPTAPGDYKFVAQVVPAGLGQSPPEPAALLAACRQPDAPIVLVDLDNTVVASGFEAVLLGTPKPMEQSRRVLGRLARTRTIVYLTHRPEMLGPKSKRWLADNDFARGPLLAGTVGGFLKGSGAYKAARIAELRKTFSNLEIGIGDKVSDARAYLDSGMRAIVILDMPAAGAKDRRPRLMGLADELKSLKDDEKVQVVIGWDQAEKAIFDGEACPPSAMRQRLLDLAKGE